MQQMQAELLCHGVLRQAYFTADNAQATSAANAQDIQTQLATAVATASASSTASNGKIVSQLVPSLACID